MKHLNCGVFFFWTHHSCPEFNRWGTAIRASLITCCFYWMLTGLLLLILKQMSWNILYFSLPERPQQKWITFVALDQILSEMKCDFPQAPLQPPGGGTKDEPAPSHPPTHFHCCQHCSRLRGRGRSEKRAFPALGPLPPPGFPASHLSEGWHSKYKQPLSVSISTGSKLLGAPGVTDPEASTHDQGAVHPNSFTGAPREPLPAFQHLHTMRSLFSELRNSCPGHPVPNSFGQRPYTELAASGDQASSFQGWGGAASSPATLASWLTASLSALRAPPGRGKLGADKLSGFCPVSQRLARL